MTLPPDSPARYVSEAACEGVGNSTALKTRYQQAIPETLGSPVKVKPVLFLLLFSVGVSTAQAADPQPSDPKPAPLYLETQPVDTTQLVAWLTGGVSTSRLARLVTERGLATLPTRTELGQVESAGADGNLMRALSAGNAQSAKIGAPIPLGLLNASADARRQHYHEAEMQLRQVLNSTGINSDEGSSTGAALRGHNSALHFALGQMLRHQEQWDDAFDELTEATRLMPALPENHCALAYLFFRLDDGPNAIAEARTALSIDPNNSEAYQYLGLGLYANGQYPAAVRSFNESLARDHHNPDTYYNMGIALHADGDLPGAIAAYRQAIRLKPDFWEAHSNLGLILHEQGNLDEAVFEYREAKRLAPGEASIRNNLGNTYCDEGNFDAAIGELSELYRQHPEWQQGHTCLANAYMSKRNYDAAVDQLRLAVQQNPTASAEHRVLGQVLLLDNQPEEAVRELRIAVSLNPDSESAHHVLGMALFQQNQLHAAEKEFREALRLNGSAENHFVLAACLTSLDRYEEALAELDAAARLDPDRTLYRARREELLKLMKETNQR